MPEFIEREATLKKIDTAIGEYAQHGEIVRFIGDCRASVIYAPAADVVEVVHGEWVKDTTFDLCGIDYYKCSVCGKEQQIEYPYCPNCGAKMDGEKNG